MFASTEKNDEFGVNGSVWWQQRCLIAIFKLESSIIFGSLLIKEIFIDEEKNEKYGENLICKSRALLQIKQ